MPAEPFYCIHCLRSSAVVRTFYEELPELIAHIGKAHHPNQPLHARDWLWGDGELSAWRETERQSEADITDTFRRLDACNTVEDFLELL